MKKLFAILTAFTISLGICCNAQVRQRHIIFILDCTKSMKGYQGAEDVWDNTKNFIERTIKKEVATSRITVLPFQNNVKPSISAEKKDFTWTDADNKLNEYVEAVTRTNIVKAWREGVKLLDPTYENILILLTDGNDNDGNSEATIAKVFQEFCDGAKNQHAHGYYVQLTKAATIPTSVQSILDNCDRTKIIRPGESIDGFNEVIGVSKTQLTTRNLPDTITVSFSNNGNIETLIDHTDCEQFIDIYPLSKTQKSGRMQFVISSKSIFADDIDALNQAIGQNVLPIHLSLKSKDVVFENMDVNLELSTKPARSLEIVSIKNTDNLYSTAKHTNPFLWIDETPDDTITFDLGIKFNQPAVDETATVRMQLLGIDSISPIKAYIDGKEIKENEFLLVAGKSSGKLQLVIPAPCEDTDLNLILKYIDSEDLDQINGHAPLAYKGAILRAKYTTQDHWLKNVLFYTPIAIVILIGLWFAVRRKFISAFSNGTIQINTPVFKKFQLKGFHKVIISSAPVKQSLFKNIFIGRSLNIVINDWPSISNSAVIPAQRNRARFISSDKSLIVLPGNTWTKNQLSEIEISSREGRGTKVCLIYF